ncbi:MAG TPA: tRNA (adenosine(37)-N6)-threonylcarbamoyltransferase complex dimerization subunit type 1 TsaB [Candidatus Binatia bacterium]|jgi:tRNA threonylcarbamoyladenosine biosynthesis protein TsaB
MRILGVDTSSAHASVAIVENGRLISEKFHRVQAAKTARAAHPRNNNHAATLLPLIDSALKVAALNVNDISAFAVAIGPGSFTGLRIGLSTVKGLAYGSGAPLVGVSTLQAIAARISDFTGVICAILDARKKEVYAAIFRRRPRSLERLTDDGVMSCERLGELLRQFNPPHAILLTGDGTTAYGERLVLSLGNEVRVCQNETTPTVAAAVARLGEADLAFGALPRGLIAPHYLRPAEAQLGLPKSA